MEPKGEPLVRKGNLVERNKDPLRILHREIINDILLSAKAPKKEGKGYEYPVMGHLVGLEMGTRGDRQKMNAMAGY